MKIRHLIVGLLVTGLLCGCSSGGQDQVDLPVYTVISEDVPNFDTTPIRYDNYGFFYLENGSYGFIEADNSVLIPAGTYHSLRYLPNNRGTACLYPEQSRLPRSYDNVSVDQKLGLEQENLCEGGVGEHRHWAWIGEDGIVYTMDSGTLEPMEPTDYAMVLGKSSMSDGTNIDYSNCYIASKDLNHIYGPYSPNEVPGFSMLHWHYNDSKDYPYFDSICLDYAESSDYNFGMFYEKTD